MEKLRKIVRVIDPQYAMEGAGVRLLRSISPNRTNQFDPFLLFDHFAFNDPVEGPILGFPMHPHRGIETVTYILDGIVNHRDSLGNSGQIGPGDVQWMTSGSGILHEEMPKRGKSGVINGFQLWVNLPSWLKMTEPRYQEVNSSSIPQVSTKEFTVRVVAGDILGTKGPVTQIAANPIYADVLVEPGAEFSLHIPETFNVVAYVFEGSGFFESESINGDPISATKMLQFGEGNHFWAKAAAETSLRFMLIAGEPFKEPIVPYGPFVMNTVEEIQQAIHELRNGTFIKQ